MNINAVLALTAALVGLAGCTDKELETAIAAIQGNQERLDQLNQDQDGRIAALYAQVSSQAQESTSSSSSIAASQEVAEQPVATPEPPKEPCTTGAFRLYDCVDGWRVYW